MESTTDTTDRSAEAPDAVLILAGLQERGHHALHYCFLICDYLQLNQQFDLAAKVKQAQLLDRKTFEAFKRRIKEHEATEDLVLTLPEAILYVTVFELACKCFVSNVMDEMRVYFSSVFGMGDDRFAEFRHYFLRLARELTAPVREHLCANPVFARAIEQVDNLEFDTD